MRTTWALALAAATLAPTSGAASADVTEAPTGFDTRTNGFVSQSKHRENLRQFEEQETITSGLGPVYTSRACLDCHSNPVTGGVSQVSTFFAGHLDAIGTPGSYTGATVELGSGRTLSLAGISGFIASRAICPEALSRLPEDGSAEPIRTGHLAPSTLGDGFVEAIADATLLAIRDAQPGQSGGQIKGEATSALISEAGFVTPKFGVGRFAVKANFSSLLSFTGGSYLVDLGITNRIVPVPDIVSECDTVPDPEDSPDKPVGKQGVDKLTAFMRATKALHEIKCGQPPPLRRPVSNSSLK
jgi:CxxC motif-containing protein (DUF1111 family)